jgi:hypothetical protein
MDFWLFSDFGLCSGDLIVNQSRSNWKKEKEKSIDQKDK